MKENPRPQEEEKKREKRKRYKVKQPASEPAIFCSSSSYFLVLSPHSTDPAAIVMDNSIMSPPQDPLAPEEPATALEKVLVYTRYAYPLALFIFFLVSLAWWGIKTSQSSRPSPPSVSGVYEAGRRNRKKRNDNGNDDGGGLFSRIAGRFPGGTMAKSKKGSDDKLTPTRKAVFNWLLVGVIVTFVANSANVILHALTTRGWWCGQAYVVRNHNLSFYFSPSSRLRRLG